MKFIILVNHPVLHHGLITIILLGLLARPSLADTPGQSAGSDPNDPYGQQRFSPSMGAIIIVLIAALFFMGFFSIYIRHCSTVGSSSGGASRTGIIGTVARSMRGTRGLDRAVVESFPTFTYSAVKELKVGKGALECAVCLTEFDDDDTLRLIPKCDHVFHPECIDEWLLGHTTCPVCRANLADGGASFHAPQETGGEENAVEVGPIEECEGPTEENSIPEDGESMEQPLHGMNRSRTMRRNMSVVMGRPRWFGKFSRSFSTGHVAVKQWDRFTLRLPEEVRKQVMSGSLHLQRSTSLVVLPREASTRRGYRTGFGEGSSRPGRFGSVRVDRGVRSDRWVFSLAPPFFSRAPSVRSPKGSMDSRQGSVRTDSTRLPV